MTFQINTLCGWFGMIQDFLAIPKQEWHIVLHELYAVHINRPADDTQHAAWEQSFEILQKELKQLVQLKPELGDYTIIFEYEIPHKGGERPDVIILGGSIYVLEFRDSAEIIQSHVDAVDAFARDLRQYHAESRQSEVIPVLVLIKTKNSIKRIGDVVILSPDHISDFFNVQAELETESLIDPVRWLSAEN